MQHRAANRSLFPQPLHTLKLPQLRLRAVATSLCAEMKLRRRPENGASCPVLVVVWRGRVSLCLQLRTSSEVLDSSSASLAVIAGLRWDAARLGSYMSGLVIVGRGECVFAAPPWSLAPLGLLYSRLKDLACSNHNVLPAIWNKRSASHHWHPPVVCSRPWC